MTSLGEPFFRLSSVAPSPHISTLMAFTATGEGGPFVLGFSGADLSCVMPGGKIFDLIGGGITGSRSVDTGVLWCAAVLLALLVGGNVDNLDDFSHGVDRIDLESAVFTGLGAAVDGGGAEVQIAKLAAGRVLDHTDLFIL